MKDISQKRPRRNPRKIPPIPDTLKIGDFVLEVKQILTSGTWRPAELEFRGVSGTAWLKLDCGGFPFLTLDPSEIFEFPGLPYSLEIVAEVDNPQTQIRFDAAQKIKPAAEIGESLDLFLHVHPSEIQEIVQLGKGLIDWLEFNKHKGEILVEFTKVNIQISKTPGAPGEIVSGKATYPAVPKIPKLIQRTIAGFVVTISALTLTPEGASGKVSVQLPGGIADVDTCLPAKLELGEIRLTPKCNLYVDAPRQAYGPWLLGDTGLIVEGTGYILDLSLTQSPTGWAPSQRGLLLKRGTASGEDLVPEPCNTGYLRGKYAFGHALVKHDGFFGQLNLQDSFSFEALNPCHTFFNIGGGWLLVTKSEVTAGEFGPGEIKLSPTAVCHNNPGETVAVRFTKLTVQTDLDLAGEVDFGGDPLSWGELNHAGEEMIVWTAAPKQGYAYLPAGPLPSFCPESGGSFVQPPISFAANPSLTALENYGISGVTFLLNEEVLVFSPDRPGGVSNPILFPQIMGWLRVGCQGVDGELYTYWQKQHESLGEPARPGYVGGVPFEVDLFVNDRRILLAQYITSAVYDSAVSGAFNIPVPCMIPALEFNDMQITSTAHLVGGDVPLPVGGVPLDYWQLQLVPTGNPNQTGVVSVRTGRIIFTAAGISEDVHFSEPFRLTWGEMLANGNLGDLYFDYNNFGQRFDGIPFNPHAIMLSEFTPGTPDPYLATCGSIHFNFFGPGYVNIRDARDANAAAPFFNRLVKVPKNGDIAGCEPTNLHLMGTWKDILSNDLAVFDCPDVSVDYNNSLQEGFIGSGNGEIAFFHSDGLDIMVEIHADATDIRLSSATNHDIDLGLFARVGGISQINGCARIEGPLLTRMSFYGVLEQSAVAGTGILEPKAGYAVEINITTTPSSLDFYASGDMLMSVSGVDLEISALVHLLFDFAVGSAEGELIGRVDCDAALAGLSGEGQLTWYAGPSMQYLQGRMKVYVCSWVASGGMEGGFFIGHQVPKNLAWVLRPTDPHFGVSDAILPDTLTGLFGYGQLSFGINYYVLGGGVSLYAGMGAFSEIPPGLTSAWGTIAGLPYVIGSCGIYVHGEILGGLVSASAWATLSLRGPVPTYFEGTFGLEGCVAWVLCASVDITGGVNGSGFYLY